MGRSPDYVGQLYSDKPNQRRSKSGFEDVVHPANTHVQRAFNHTNHQYEPSNFLYQQRSSIKSFAGRNDLISGDLVVPPRVGRSVITSNNRGLLPNAHTTQLKGLSTFLAEETQNVA